MAQVSAREPTRPVVSPVVSDASLPLPPPSLSESLDSPLRWRPRIFHLKLTEHFLKPHRRRGGSGGASAVGDSPEATWGTGEGAGVS